MGKLLIRHLFKYKNISTIYNIILVWIKITYLDYLKPLQIPFICFLILLASYGINIYGYISISTYIVHKIYRRSVFLNKQHEFNLLNRINIYNVYTSNLEKKYAEINNI